MKGECVLAGQHSESYIGRRRKKAYETQLRKKPYGFKLVAGCGNSQCIALDHIRLKPWASFGRKSGN